MIEINRVKIRKYYQMGLSINPIAIVIGAAAAGIAAQRAAAEKAPAIANAADKKAIDDLVANASGAPGTPFNGLTPNGVLDKVTTGVKGASDAISTPLGDGSTSSGADAIGVLQQATGGLANAGADISSALSKIGGGNLAGGVQDFAAGISKGAGVLNNLLSLKRAENLPAEGELFAQGGQGVRLSTTNREDWRVRIDCDWTIFSGNKLFDQFKDGGVVFPTIPTVNFSSKANYSSIDPTHNNYPFQAYKNSQIDEIMISGEFTAETAKDAGYWIGATTFFKTATKMFFGQGENVGAPPIICTLNGFGASVFNDVPVVIKSFSIDFPNDVNYIRCDTYGSPTWVPIVSTLAINVQPVYNRRNLRQFSLTKYASGSLTTPTGQGYL
jgi:hypothetical protein